MYLQQRTEVWSIDYDGVHTYGEIYRQQEIEHCIYNFELADVERQRTLCDLYNAEAEACIERGLVAPAHDYVLRQSQAFNILDTRGAIGVTERAKFFARDAQPGAAHIRAVRGTAAAGRSTRGWRTVRGGKSVKGSMKRAARRKRGTLWTPLIPHSSLLTPRNRYSSNWGARNCPRLMYPWASCRWSCVYANCWSRRG